MTNEATLLKYITDMASAEHHLIHTLKAQESDSDLKAFPGTADLIARIRSSSELHLIGLEELAQAFKGEVRGGFKEAVTAVTGAALGAVSHLRSHNVSKMLRDDYTALGLISIGYSMLHTTALALTAPDVAEVSLKFLKESASLIIEISQAVVPIVVDELAGTNAVNRSVAETAGENIREAWRSA